MFYGARAESAFIQLGAKIILTQNFWHELSVLKMLSIWRDSHQVIIQKTTKDCSVDFSRFSFTCITDVTARSLRPETRKKLKQCHIPFKMQ